VNSRTLAFALLLAVAPSVLAAQELRGIVTQPDSTTPAAGVIIEVRSSDDVRVAQTVSDATGQFFVRIPTAGTFTLRGLRIGHRPTPFGTITLADGERREMRFVLRGGLLTLAEVRVVGARVCGRRAMGASAVADMLEEARKAMQVAQYGAATTTTAQWVIENQMATLAGRVGGPITADIIRGTTSQPFVSIPADSLAKVGFGVADEVGWTFHAPDADVLTSDAFVDNHCFRTVPPARGMDRGWIGLAFEPPRVRGDTKIGISGTLWLHRASAELRRLDYTYTNLPRWMSTRRAGGQVAFHRVSDDLWIVQDWSIRMPSTRPDDPRTRYVSTRAPDGRTVLVPRATALKVLTGRVQVVRRDGTILFGSDSAGTAPQVITAETVATFCSRPLPPGTGVLWGVVRDSSNAVADGGTVEIEWDADHRWAGPDLREWQTLGRTATTSNIGLWVACEVPIGVPLAAQAISSGIPGPIVSLVIPHGSLGFEVRMLVGAAPPRATGRRVRGVVVDSLRGGAPVAEADVRVIGTSRRTFADSLGRFEFDSLPTGELALSWWDIGHNVLRLSPPVATTRDGDVVMIASPSPRVFGAAVCGDTLPTGTGVIIGEVRDAMGRVRGGAEVAGRWNLIRVSEQQNDIERREAKATTDSTGRYALCGVPINPGVSNEGGVLTLLQGDVELEAALIGGMKSGLLTVALEGAGAARRDIVVGFALPDPLEGRVIDADGAAIPNATVMLLGTEAIAVRTDSTGEFALPGMLRGSLEVVVRALGYLPQRRALDPVGGRFTLGNVKLEKIPQQLDASVIVGQRMDTRRGGFNNRRETRRGTFLDEETLSRMPITLNAIKSRIPRAQLAGRPGDQSLFIEYLSGMGSGLCAPIWYVDGTEYRNVFGAEQLMILTRAKMIEVYRAWDAPPEFMDPNGCGSVVVWTSER
jgi:hypothetical protein